MIDFRIDVRDADTNVLVGTARSYQTSLAAMGHSFQDIIRTAVDVLAQGLSEPVERRQPKPRKRSRAAAVGSVESDQRMAWTDRSEPDVLGLSTQRKAGSR